MSEPLVDRQFLERLERLTLNWQSSFRGLVGGHNMSHFAGSGQEFLDHRTFHQGDDLRSINWRAFMRFDKLFLKLFQVEPRVPVRLLLDVSGSMVSGSPAGETSKFDYARKLAAALVYVGLVRLDSISIQPFSSRLQDAFLSSGGRHRFQPAELFLRELSAGGNNRFVELAKQYLERYSQRSLMIIISDFLSDDDPVRPLQYLADFGHELFLVQLWGTEDRLPTQQGDLEVVDAETGNSLRLTIDPDVLAGYTAAFDEHAAALRRVSLSNQGRYISLSTRIPIEEAMFGPMAMMSGQ